jgi:ribosomal-protein-serine acetyltransferase
MHGTEPARLAPPDSTSTLLTDGQVTIRPFRSDDSQPLFEGISESLPQLCTWLTWCQPDYSLADCGAYILKSQDNWQKGEQFNFGTFDAKTNALLGSVALNQVNRAHNFANLGYWIRTSRAGQGFGTASVKLITQFAFDWLHLTRVEIIVPAGNHASHRTAVKAGATLEGSLRNRLILSGKLHDGSLYSLLPHDQVYSKSKAR